MKQAPPVSVRCHGGWPWRVFRSVMPALATGVMALWLTQHGVQAGAISFMASSPAHPVIFSTLLALLVAAGTWEIARPRPFGLVWDGQHWCVDGAAGRVTVMMDLGPWLLLRWWPVASVNDVSRWLPIAGYETAGAWHALRAALYSRTRPLLPDSSTHGNPSPSPSPSLGPRQKANRLVDGQP